MKHQGETACLVNEKTWFKGKLMVIRSIFTVCGFHRQNYSPLLSYSTNLRIKRVDMYKLLLLGDPFLVSVSELRQNCSHLVFEARFLPIPTSYVDWKNRIRMIMQYNQINCAV